MPKAPRIAIVGAGPAGLLTAWNLRRVGIEHPVIFEMKDRPGGKARTYREGDQLWNLGTSYTTLGFKTIHRLQKRYGVGDLKLPEASIVSELGSSTDFVTYILGDGGRIALYNEGARYLAHWTRLYVATGFSYNAAATSHPELAMPISEWLAKHDMPAIQRLYNRAFTVMGYGPTDSTPMLYGFRWVTPLLLISGILNKLWVPQAFEDVFIGLADEFDVRYGHEVMDLARVDAGIKVVGKDWEEHFDHVVLATDFSRLAEQELESLIGTDLSINSSTWGLGVHPLVDDGGQPPVGGVKEQIDNPKPYGLSGWRRAEGPVGVAGTIYTAQIHYTDSDSEWATIEQFDAALAAQLERLGLEVGEPLHQEAIPHYGPRLSSDQVRKGVLASEDGFVRDGPLWFTGALFSHESTKALAAETRKLAVAMARETGVLRGVRGRWEALRARFGPDNF